MRHRLGVLVVIGLLAACGGGDDAEPTADDTGSAVSADDSDDGGNDDTAGDDLGGDDANDANDDGGNTRSISDLDDIPDECRRIMGDFLREIEPIVSEVDWDDATLADLEELGTSLDVPELDIDAEMAAADCDDIDFDGDDERGFDLSLELARQEAPGTVGWLEFIREMATSFDPPVAAGEPADAPEDCEAAKEAIQELISETDSMTELPVDEFLAVSTILQSVTTLCSIDEMTELFDDPEFQEWTGG